MTNERKGFTINPRSRLRPGGQGDSDSVCSITIWPSLLGRLHIESEGMKTSFMYRSHSDDYVSEVFYWLREWEAIMIKPRVQCR